MSSINFHKIKLFLNSHFLLGAIYCSIFSLFRANYCYLIPSLGTSGKYCLSGYSDIRELFITRNLIHQVYPYLSASNSFEYPPVIGIGNWLLSFLVPFEQAEQWFYIINAALITSLFALVVKILNRTKPDYIYLIFISPALICVLYTNWDMWVVAPTLLAIYNFDKNSYTKSALFLGISISTKFFPIVLLLPIFIILFRKNKILILGKYILVTTVTWLLINIPVMIISFDGWARFLTLNKNRGADLGSVYLSWQLLHIEIREVNLLFVSISALFYLLSAIYMLKLETIPNLSQVSFLMVAIFTSTSKVYSPQYVIWSLPLAIIALINRKQTTTLLFWQLAEFLHFAALIAFFELRTNSNYEFVGEIYGLFSLLRVFAIWYFVFTLHASSQLSISKT